MPGLDILLCDMNDWLPAIYDDDNWTPVVGEGLMGGFAKDWLHEQRDNDLPAVR